MLLCNVMLWFQVVYVATYAYFLLALVGYQILSEEPEIFFPFFLILKFVFFIGLLKVDKYPRWWEKR